MPASSTSSSASHQRSRSQDSAAPTSLPARASPPRHADASSNSRSVSAASTASDRSDRLASASSPAARRHSAARSEASAKMKATLSAASSDKGSNHRAAATERNTSNTLAQDRAPNATSSNSSVTPGRKPAARDAEQARLPHRSATFDDTLSTHPINSFRSDAANLPAIPVQAFTRSSSQNGVASHFHDHDTLQSYTSSAYGVAPLMTSPSRSAPLPASHHNATATPANANSSASPNARVRSQTAALANAASPHSSYGANPSDASYHAPRSMRTSPQMRALPQQNHAFVPSLQSLGSSVLPSSANGSVNGASAPISAATSPSHSQTHSGPQWERHTTELTNCIVAFLSPILPTEEEYRIKEATRRQLERLANRVSPGAKLLAFGSMANGFALRNSDMDLCCLIGKGPDGQPTTQHTASELVEILGQLIREETDFTVMPLPKARIPIIKINRSPTADLPYEIACDIGFENRLALENTRLLLSYAMVDPPRLRTLVLFLKVWAKRRKLNSPYMGTLSSYGYTLMVLFFLAHVKKPAVLPNLQRVPPTRTMKPDEMELNGNNIYFYDDVAALRKAWTSHNTDNVGELLIDFFRYFSKEFSYARDVISLKSETGLLSKDSKSWNAELCIEDPFQMGYNVSRTVTKDGLYTIRGEFMRASRILANARGQKISALIADLCEEREDSLSRAPDGPGSMQRYPYNSYLGMGGAAAGGTSFHASGANGARRYRDTYGTNRRYDANSISGYGGSFAFEQMARGLSQGVAYPPTAAMLAPLSRTHGLSPKPQPPRFAAVNAHGAEAGASFSSAQSDSGGYAPLDFTRASIGHASARTSPSFKHAVPAGFHSTNGPGAQEAFAYGAEISFGAPSVASTRDDLGSTPRGKTSRSFSETLNRSKSLPRAAALANAGHHRAAVSAANAAASASLNPYAHATGSVATPAAHASYYESGSPQPLAPTELESRMATLSVQRAASSSGLGPRRLSNSSHASSSAHFDSNSASTLQCSSASSPWSLGPAAVEGRRPSHHQQQADTHALVQEYLRRAAQLGADPTLSIDADKLGFRVHDDAAAGGEQGDEHETGSVISEATLDELARLSELDDVESSASPEWRAVDAAWSSKQESAAAVSGERAPSPPRSSLRLPESILQQAKMRRKAQQHAEAAAAAVAAVSSGIARKDRENCSASSGIQTK
ncbi:related to caffeine-induced death protein 1 Cid1 [Sporisorium reilianum f. sp. reilianum]|uniref:polynucleotide adenylyltransferase n=1 Tax=Sporisorium reilianum f. sp. reilianum TaxID=72559 RepID=A0A2N8UJW3_9BASI|nr:related to caffeine-induced death protein 1 Cid1 [Sporisorium reilianum f. sp. reilianum]